MPRMPQAPEPSHAHVDPTVVDPTEVDPDEVDPDEVVLGVDTHKDVHVAAVISALGVLLGTRSFPTTASGYQQMLRWATGFGTLRRAGVECTGSYGAALARHLVASRSGLLRSTSRTRPPGDDAARPTRSMPKQRPARCCPDGRAPPPRPVTAR